MTTAISSLRIRQPYALPARLPASLGQVCAYWSGLLRGGARMPFWDDVNLDDLADARGSVILIDAFERPRRFRLDSVGTELTRKRISGRFLDEIEPEPPFDFLASQCCATVECGAPTFFPGVPEHGRTALGGYGRLLLPLWGDGRVSMLLGVVKFR